MTVGDLIKILLSFKNMDMPIQFEIDNCKDKYDILDLQVAMKFDGKACVIFDCTNEVE